MHSDVDWYCDFIGLNLYKHQKAMLYMIYKNEIIRMRKVIDSMDAYKRGYQRALEDINMPMAVVADRWKPSACPRCNESFADYEQCDDGYYKRAVNLYRCPFCGQKLDWDVVDL